MKRTLYDSRAIPLDVLFREMDNSRGRFGDPATEVLDAHDAPKPATDDEAED